MHSDTFAIVRISVVWSIRIMERNTLIALQSVIAIYLYLPVDYY